MFFYTVKRYFCLKLYLNAFGEEERKERKGYVSFFLNCSPANTNDM